MLSGLEALSALIVDDNRHAREVAKQLCRGFGLRQIYEAADAKTAWEIAEVRQPDLILLDFALPDQNGAEFLRWLRASNDPFAQTSIILITGYSDLTRVGLARDAGESEILVKPLTSASLLSRIIAVIDRPRPFVRCSAYAGPDRRRTRQSAYAGPLRRSSDPVFLDDSATPNRTGTS